MTNGEVNKNIGKNMDKMETSISDLQGELNVANEPSKKHFKPGWLLIALVVALIVGVGSYLVATRFVKVDKNSVAIKQACELRNEQAAIVNAKFNQLVLLFDASLNNRQPGEPPPSEEILKLYGEFRKPIPMADCKKENALRSLGPSERIQLWTARN